jgi:hypothetical protein
MGIGLNRRKAWEKDPHGEGCFNLVFAMIFVVIYIAYNLIWGNFSFGGNIMCAFIAGWGIISFVFGELLHWINKKAKQK